MDNERRFDDRRFRTAAAAAAVTLTLAAAGALAGIGLAKGSPPAAPHSPGKVTICHKTHSPRHPSVTITVSLKAWRAHQRHGDALGACVATTTTTTTTEQMTTTEAPGKSGEHGKGDAHKPHGHN